MEMDGGMRSSAGGNFRSDMSDFDLKNAAEMEAHIAMNAAAARANFDKYYAERLTDVSRLYRDQKRRLDVKEPLEVPTMIVDVGVSKFDFTKLQEMFNEKEEERKKAKEERQKEAEAGKDAAQGEYTATELFVNVNTHVNQDDPLKLKLNGVDYTNIDKVVKAIKESTNITRLEMSSCSLDHDDCDSIGVLISSNKSITELDLSANKFATEGLEKLVEPLSRNSQLVSLDLGSNSLGKSAAKLLSKIWSSPDCRLERMQLAANTLGIYGAEALVPGLQENKTIKTLGLQYNGLGNDGISFLKEAFEGGKEDGEKDETKKNTTLFQVSLESNKADSESVDAIAKYCWKNSQVLELQHLEGVEAAERTCREEEVDREWQLLQAFATKAKEDVTAKAKEEAEKKKAAPAGAGAKGKSTPQAGTPAKSPAKGTAKAPAPKPAAASKSPAKTVAKTPAKAVGGKASKAAPAPSSQVKAAAPKKSASPKKK